MSHTANLSNWILSKICLTSESFRSWISCFYLNFSSSSESDSSWVTQLVSFELVFESLRILTISLNFRTTPIQNSVYVTLWGDSRTSLLNFWLISHEINLSFKHSHFANVLIYHQGSDIRLLLADCLTEDFLITRINLIEIFGIKLWWFMGTFRNLWQDD